MLVVGLLSTEEEAKEIQFIAKVATLEDRIHFIVKYDKLKRVSKEQR